MKRLIQLFIILLIASFFMTETKGQEVPFPSLKGYDQVSDYPVYTPDDLWNYIDGAADAYLALGFIDLHINEYVKGKQSVKAELYRFGNDEQAFGMYSLERSPDYTFISMGVQGYREEGVVNFYKGAYYVKMMTHSKSKKVNESMTTLANMIAERLPGKNDFPASVKAFPAEGLLHNQETYLLEGVLGHDYLRGAFRASYEVSGDRFDIYIINSQSAAEAALATSRLTNSPVSAVTDESEKYVLEDGYNGLLFIVRKSAKIVIISGLSIDKSELAEHYLELIIK